MPRAVSMLLKVLSAVFATVLLTSVSVVIGVVQAPTANAAACSDGIVLLGASGSGQRAEGAPPTLGAEVTFALSEMRTQLNKQKVSIRSQIVDYPAEHPSTLLLPGAGMDIFFNGLQIGVDNAIAQLYQIQNGLRTNPMCAGPRIVLAGYSQGAMVMHRVLERLYAGPDANPELLGRIAGVLLISDGDRMAGETKQLYKTTTSKTSGVGAVRAAQSGASAAVLPEPLRNLVFSVCVPKDLVCDHTNKYFGNVLRWKEGVDVHTSAYKKSTQGAVPPLVSKIVKALQTPLQFDLSFEGLDTPYGVDLDSAGAVFVADRNGNRIVKMSSNYLNQSTVLDVGINRPTDVAVGPDDSLYITDTWNHRVIKLAPGSKVPQPLPFSGLYFPEGIDVDSAGAVYVVDSGNNRVVKLRAGSTAQEILPFTGMDDPWGIVVDKSGNVLVVDTYKNRVLKLAPGAKRTSTLPFKKLDTPLGITTDAGGNPVVVDYKNNRVVTLKGSAQIELPFTGLATPVDVATDSSGSVFVTSSDNNKVLQLFPR